MSARVNGKTSALTAVLLGGLLAASSDAGAAAPWFQPGGPRASQGERVRNRDRRPDDDRDREQRRKMYSEQRFIRLLYEGFLNRQPSPGEMNDWLERFGRDVDPTELVQQFMDSDEFFVRETYRGLLGREADSAGLKNYVSSLQDGWSRAEVVEAFLSSEEFRKRMRQRGGRGR